MKILSLFDDDGASLLFAIIVSILREFVWELCSVLLVPSANQTNKQIIII